MVRVEGLSLSCLKSPMIYHTLYHREVLKEDRRGGLFLFFFSPASKPVSLREGTQCGRMKATMFKVGVGEGKKYHI